MSAVRAFLTFVFFCWSGAAAAQVEIAFYSKDFASTFPHAYVRLTGIDSAGQRLDVNYGFTPVRISPAVLLGPIAGRIQTVSPEYVARSDRHFSLKLTSEKHQAVLAVIERWRTAPQPSYSLNRRNCVHFVGEIATALGLNAPPDAKLMKKPKSYLQKVTRDNQELIASWQDRFAPLPASSTTD